MASNSAAGFSAAPAAAQAVAAGFLGLVLLPAALGEGQLPTTTPLFSLAWLAGAVVVAVWLLLVAPPLARWAAGPLAALDRARPGLGVALARWLVAAGYVALAPAILRRPIVAVLGQVAEPTTVEASFAAISLALLILALYRLHWTASPLVEDATLRALDALVPTTGSAAPKDQPTAVGTIASGSAEASRSERSRQTGKVPEATRASAGETTRTAAGQQAGAEVGETVAADAATVADGTPQAGGEATLPVGEETMADETRPERA
jgi:hypothetical protein